ncbi:hypothetical protein H8S55_02460 [Flintibacter sp. BX5]|uniref:Uncharacterized protein n=1 Tax=Flintibacter faecis TaxID=2763047 RepID=A0A8J6IVN2_9FIRM|nr:hypothetical protein [Flintibacter faecis]
MDKVITSGWDFHGGMGEKAQFHIESDWNYLYKLYNHTAEPSSKIAVNQGGKTGDVSPSGWPGGRMGWRLQTFL